MDACTDRIRKRGGNYPLFSVPAFAADGIYMLHTGILKENRDFRRLYAKGNYQAHPFLVTYALRNRGRENRFGITASKKIGNAVQRNRAKRLIRTAYRLLEAELPVGWDFVFVARTKTTQMKMQQVQAVMKKQLRAVMSAQNSNGKNRSRVKKGETPHSEAKPSLDQNQG